MKTSNYTVLLLWILIISIIFSIPAYAQEFDMDATSRFQRGFLRGDMFDVPQAGSAGPSRSDTPDSAPASQADDSLQEKVKFPSSQEVLAKSDVSHIDPKTYILGPGDRFNVTFYGMVSKTEAVIVQPDGTIFIAPAKPIFVQDLTIDEAQRKIHRIMLKYYKGFNIEIQLLTLRTFKIEILGEVNSPGTYIINPNIGVCDAIGLADGIKMDSSLRNVELRNLKTGDKERIDLFAWFFMGDDGQNRLLKKDQVIYVPLMKSRVSVEGAFKRAGTFEIIPGEKIYDLAQMVEPGTSAVLNEVKITRIGKDKNLLILPVNLEEVMNDPKSEENIPLTDGDIVFAPQLSIFLKKITVVGELQGTNFFTKQTNRLTGQAEIMKIGQYKIREGEKVKDVVIALGGPTIQADLENARIERPESEGLYKKIPLDLKKILDEDDESHNLLLQPGDRLIVPAKPSNVYLLGEIRAPGPYQYNVGNKIKDYVALAGGPTRRARMRQGRVISQAGDKITVRNIDLRSIMTGNEPDFELSAGDVIYLPYADINGYQDILQQITDIVVLLQIFKK